MTLCYDDDGNVMKVPIMNEQTMFTCEKKFQFMLLLIFIKDSVKFKFNTAFVN